MGKTMPPSLRWIGSNRKCGVRNSECGMKTENVTSAENFSTSNSALRSPHSEMAQLAGGEQPMEVSVCIANWNCREMLRECLRSLLRQPQGVRLEIIVVDNA